MRESETFDAFYARTVSGITSQLHALASGDPQADHAIREAYARAYQQWFEVSGYRDPEGWVLGAAKDIFARRQAQVEAAAPPAAKTPAAKTDSGSWPGFFRPRQQPPPDPEATVAPAAAAAGAAAQVADAAAPGAIGPAPNAAAYAGVPQQTEPPPGPSSYLGDPYQSPGAYGAPFPADQGGPYGPAQLTPDRAGRPRAATTGGIAGSLPTSGSGRALIAVVGVLVLAAVAVGGYLAFGRGHAAPAATPQASNGTNSPAPVQMLGAGKTGPLRSVPWQLVGAGWVLAEFSPGQPGSGGGPVGTYLVDPEGGRYWINRNWPDAAETTLVAWSGDKKTALFATTSGGSTSYSLLNVHTGVPAQLTLPAGVALAGFTRPDGLNLLAVRQVSGHYKLQRYDLQGAHTATLATMAVRGGQPAWTGACSAIAGCAALSSPGDASTGKGAGDTVVWGISGDEMQLVSNAGGVIRRLHVPDSGNPPSCTPVSWWNTGTVLASCAAQGQPGETRLWLVPTDGSGAEPLSLPSGSASGDGIYTGAWQAGGQVYVTATSSSQCPSEPSGPGGLGIFRLADSGSDSAVSVPGSSGYHNAILGAAGSKLLVQAQTSCPGPMVLEWFDPVAGSTTPLMAAESGQAGVVAAVAFGAG